LKKPISTLAILSSKASDPRIKMASAILGIAGQISGTGLGKSKKK
jgi:hypothetical protein